MLAPSAPDAKRIFDRLERLYEIGGGPGANRPGLGREEQEAHDLVASWMDEAGLAVETDPAGNLVGRLAGAARGPEVWTGSHLDTVPRGGRFDGALGVVAGLEAVGLAASAAALERTLAVVAFRDEEGWRFGRGVFGSRALCGRITEEELDARDPAGTSVREALAALGLPPPPPGGWLERGPDIFLECHVEQGPRLERAGAPLGVVTGIVGMAQGEAEFAGSAGHAGTTPMDAREDAFCAAAEFVLRARDAARAIEGAVATVGAVDVEPGAANVIPGRARVTVDVRAPDGGRLDAILAALPEAKVRVTDAIGTAPEPTEALRRELAARGLPLVELVSGAGHDAGVLAAAGVPTGMLFVRSLAGGASHSPAEDSSEDDVALAVAVLAGALTRLAASA